MDTPEPPIRALLVEDDERLARFTCEYLEGHGVSVTHAADGEAGLREARRGSHDVIILDLMLPRRSGLSVCQSLREGSDVPVLIVTARTEEADRVLGLEMGADDYLTKPFSSRELLAERELVPPAVRVVIDAVTTWEPGAFRRSGRAAVVVVVTVRAYGSSSA